MAKKIKLGDFNRLRIVKKVDFGLYLDGGDEGEILLPSRYVPEDAGIGDELDVFLYLDQEERLIATTETPLAKVGDFAYLEVKWVNEYGAFLGWGLMKDIFCPFREQKKRMVLGNSYIVHIHIDEESYRIVASAKIERYLNEDHPHYKHGEEVDLLIWQKTDLGFKVIIDNQYPGLLYQDQIFQYIHTGDKMKGYIGRVRPDGKIDVTLQKTGHLALKQRGCIGIDALVQVLGFHCGDRGGDILAAHRTVAHHNDLVEHLVVVLEDSILSRSDHTIEIADIGNFEFGTGLGGRDGITAIGVGHCTIGGTLLHDGHANERLTIAVGDDTRLLALGHGRSATKQERGGKHCLLHALLQLGLSFSHNRYRV